jgi:MFS family permease
MGNRLMFSPMRLSGVHYAWIIVALAFGLQTASSSMRLAFGTFVDPLAETYGWSKGSIGLAYAIQFASSAVFAPIAGWLGDVYGTRRTMLLGVVLFSAGIMLTGTMGSLWEFYLYYGIIVGAALAVFMVLLVSAVTYWFKTQQGLAIGLLMASFGVGPVLAAPLIVYVINRFGWGTAMMIAGLGCGLVMLLLIARFYGKPADKGERPYGALPSDPVEAPTDRAMVSAESKAFFNRARGTFNFWNLVNIHFLGCVGHSIIIVYGASIAIHQGIDSVVAAGVVSTFFGLSIASRFWTAFLADYFSPRGIMVASFFLQGVTVFLLLEASAAWHFYVFAVIFGIGYGGEGTVFPLLDRRYYKNAPFGTPYGWQMFGASLGMGLGGWIGGYLFDVTGTYTLTIIVSAATSLGGMVSILFLADPRRELIPDWNSGIAVSGKSLPHIH